jgi:polar amino acid transport system substrate-binding protein
LSEAGGIAAIAGGPALRAAINTGNRALVQQEGDRLTGISPALARRLAEAIGLPLAPVVYEGAGAVFADAGADRWDVAFLAIDPVRAEQVSFTRPYHAIEATYAVRAGSPIGDAAAADRAGVSVLSSVGSAYDLHLQKALRHARHLRIGTPGESFEAFRGGTGDVVAGIRQSLERHFGGDPAFRILPDALTRVEQAMALPGRDNPAIAALDAFLADAIASGFVARALSADAR